MRPTVFVSLADIERKSSPSVLPSPLEARIDARIRAARRNVERRARTLSRDRALELLARFDAKLARLDADVARARAAGQVTDDEAAAVRAVTVRHRRAASSGC